MAALRAGSIVRYQANVNTGGGFNSWPDVEQAVRQAAMAKGARVDAYQSSETSPFEGNVQANLWTGIDRADINDLKYDIDSAISGLSSVTLRGSAINLTSPGGQVPGTIPAPIQQDTSGQGSTILGTAGSFWLDQIGQQVQGAVKALSEGSPMMWVGVGVVLLLIFGGRDRR